MPRPRLFQRRPAGVLAALAALLLGVSACSSGAATVSAGSLPSPSVAPVPSTSPLPAPCPAGPTSLDWPPAVPAELPKPPSASDGKVNTTRDGLTIVKFSTSTSLRESILFLIDALPAAGFTLGRGDAEATEADAPFVKGPVRGILRMISTEPCSTDWLLAVSEQGAAAGGSPLLPARPSTSPLPFGG